MYESGVGPARLGTWLRESTPRSLVGLMGTGVERVRALLPRQASSSVTGPLGRDVSPALRLTPFFSRKQNKIRMREEEGTGGSGDNLHKDGNRGEIEGRRAGHVLASVRFGGPKGRGKKEGPRSGQWNMLTGPLACVAGAAPREGPTVSDSATREGGSRKRQRVSCPIFVISSLDRSALGPNSAKVKSLAFNGSPGPFLPRA